MDVDVLQVSIVRKPEETQLSTTISLGEEPQL